MNQTKSTTLFEEAKKTLVGGVNSPVRSFSSVGGNPLFIEKGRGAYIMDVDHNEYIDLVLSYGPLILGHCHPEVEAIVIATLKNGFSFGASTELEINLSQLICKTIKKDKIRFVNSGTEAVMSALRLARAITKKNKIIKFEGCYHGHADALLVSAGSGLATLSMPSSAGVSESAVKNTLIAKYNDITSVEHLIKTDDDIAAVIIEPVAGNMGVVVPQKEFIHALRRITAQKNIMLIVDEVMTGFRSKFGLAQDLLGIDGDIICLGKIIGGGFPVGAYAASETIMNRVAPLGNVYQAGTLSGNPVAMAGGLATLTVLKEINPYQTFTKYCETIEKEISLEARKLGIPLVMNHFGSMINPFFTAQTVTDFTSAKTSNTEQFKRFFWNMIQSGVFIPPSQFEAWFLSTAITENDLEKIITAMKTSLMNL